MKMNEKLIYLRKKKGLTQLQLAETVYVSRQAVSKWESGGAVPSTDNLRSLSELYEVPIDYLLNDEDDGEKCNDNTGIVDKGKNEGKKKHVRLSVALLAAAIIVGAVFASRKENRRLNQIKGEEVVVDRNFHLEW